MICLICNKEFMRVCTHVRQKHNISALEYKMHFGLDRTKGLCDPESAAKSRKATLRNQILIKNNLIAGGEKTRYKQGSTGRTRDKMSDQTRERLAIHYAQFTASPGFRERASARMKKRWEIYYNNQTKGAKSCQYNTLDT